MIYYFTKQQFNAVFADASIAVTFQRIHHWNTNISPIYRLSYTEDPFQSDPGYWGKIEGDEKHITWFLLTYDLLLNTGTV